MEKVEYYDSYNYGIDYFLNGCIVKDGEFNLVDVISIVKSECEES